MDIEPTPEQEAFYDKWSDVPYREEINEAKNETKDMFTDFMSHMFGMEMDMNDFDKSPEGFASFQQKINEQFEQSQQKQQKQKKTKKQQAFEEVKKEAEEIKNKSIRSVYLALAIVDYVLFSGKYALSQIKRDTTELKTMFETLHKFIRTFDKPNAKNIITAFINEYRKEDDFIDGYF